jgi:uncharacterized protein (DUF697 family)
MRAASLDPSAMLNRALEFATNNIKIERLLIQLGLDPNNVTYDALFERLLDLLLVHITFSSILAVIGGIFLILTFVSRTIVRMRILCIISTVFFLTAAALAGSVQHFLMYFLALPANVIRLVQIQNLVKKARNSAQGTLSLNWLRPFMTPRKYKAGDVLFHKGDVASEMFLTVSGKFRVNEIKVEIPTERILGELGFLSPNNRRTQSVECTEDGEVLTVVYDRLRHIYFQNPEFGYYFLRLAGDRLIQNYARLEGLVEQSKAELAQATAARAASLRGSEPAAAIGAASAEQEASGRSSASMGNIIVLALKRRVGLATTANTPLSPASADAKAARRRARALAIVERHANYSGAGGFIPLPIVNVVTIAAVLVRMVRALSRLYGVPFERNRAYSLVIGLLGGVMPTRLATAVTVTMVSFVPGYNLFGLAVTSVTASAYARSIGRMLIDRFEREAALDRKAALQRERLALKRGRRWTNIWPVRLAKPAPPPAETKRKSAR